ncbi:predicted protein [Meyerozyma guilliermondii ATCC 6260]|uniref:Uncharacterized protein n=1 Tax=Meyerozyma guilliermondii (strain ATCC 6260 / CBS 566 / DSM 6381 / JCM 1539 / NBRC 10279 / NRRL Y-324) TaxID=294746 RepID=A5DR81_PICGU|nr:uncharacterized protein PGUG_05782 [Meyerozyma guilliermondii ATCC 6260]EDK41683.2 predicted protein [Meyerozyma guilliermondii ATCC 6260]
MGLFLPDQIDHNQQNSSKSSHTDTPPSLPFCFSACYFDACSTDEPYGPKHYSRCEACRNDQSAPDMHIYMHPWSFLGTATVICCCRQTTCFSAENDLKCHPVIIQLTHTAKHIRQHSTNVVSSASLRRELPIEHPNQESVPSKKASRHMICM